ncbi:MAG TPA: CocE/NonD family hydrolase, partial [Microthrixaceae bacterium]|nr:CocE/NonD family hydrolase [Microthrixaceae bacterium]
MTNRLGSKHVLRIPVLLVLTAAMLMSGCSSDGTASATKDTKSDVEGVRRLSDNAADADYSVRGSVNQVSATGAEKGVRLGLYDDKGRAVATEVSDKQGSVLFRLVDPGKYRIGTTEGKELASKAVEVVSAEDSLPEQSFYSDQKLVKGFQYITTRDGTTLSTLVTLPGPIENGPYPTVVEYSGYSPSKTPTNLLADRWDDIKKSLPGDLTLDDVCAIATFACEAPDQPSSLIASALGYAVVSVNMRGTGCSGGAYDFFEPLQVLDGYDVVETAAAQPWVLNNKVGMVGLSYPGISQLFVAAENPPSLAAIAPLSVYDDTARGVLAPGGIFNEGFALTWAKSVLDSAKPYGQEWTKDVVKDGDEECADNQLLRDQNVDAVSKAKNYPYYDHE